MSSLHVIVCLSNWPWCDQSVGTMKNNLSRCHDTPCYITLHYITTHRVTMLLQCYNVVTRHTVLQRKLGHLRLHMLLSPTFNFVHNHSKEENVDCHSIWYYTYFILFWVFDYIIYICHLWRKTIQSRYFLEDMGLWCIPPIGRQLIP